MFLFLHLILQDLWTLFHKSYTQTEAEYESCIYMKYISYIHSYFIEVTDAQEIDFPFSGLTTELRASSCRRITDMYSMRHALHITFLSTESHHVSLYNCQFQMLKKKHSVYGLLITFFL